jgi:hypothetical protein
MKIKIKINLVKGQKIIKGMRAKIDIKNKINVLIEG